MDLFDDDFDTDDFLRMSVEAAEAMDQMNQEQRSDFTQTSDSRNDVDASEILHNGILNCVSASKDSLVPSGMVRTGEFKRWILNESSQQYIEGHDFLVFGLEADVLTILEERDLFLNLLLQRYSWIRERAIISRRTSCFIKDTRNESAFNMEGIFDEVASFLGILRRIAMELCHDASFRTHDNITDFIWLLHRIHIHTCTLSSFYKNIYLESVRPMSPAYMTFHVMLMARWTVVSSFGSLSRSEHKIIDLQSTRALPRFFKFAGKGWSEEFLSEDFVDSLSESQLQRLYRQTVLGLTAELIGLAQKRMRSLAEMNNSESLAFLAKQSAFDCPCVKEIWLLLIHTYFDITKKFWEIFLIFFDVLRSSRPSYDSDAITDDHNSFQLALKHEDFPLKLSFWLFNSLLGLSSISISGEMLSSPNIESKDLYTCIEKLTTHFTKTPKKFEEVETRAYLAIILTAVQKATGSSFLVLAHLWDLMYPKLNSSFLASALTVEGYQGIPVLYSDWIRQLEAAMETDVRNKNSFQIFLAIAAYQLSNSQESCLKMSQRFVSRVTAKILSSRCSNLQEQGLYNLISIYLIFAKYGPKPSDIANKLLEVMKTLFEGEIKNACILFKGLCTLFVILVDKSSLPEAPEELESSSSKVFEFISNHMDKFLSECDMLQREAVIQNFSTLIRDQVCLSGESVISQPTIFSATLVKYLENKYSRPLLQSYTDVFLRLLTYYSGLAETGTAHLSESEAAKKKQIDSTCMQVWKTLYPSLKGSLSTTNNNNSAYFKDIGELIYSLTLWSHHCLGMKFLFDSPLPPFEDAVAIFRVFGLAHHINPQVTCSYLKMILQGELVKSLPQDWILQSWSRIMICLHPKVSMDSELQCEMDQVREVIQSLKFFQKLNQLSNQPINQDLLVTVIIRISNIYKNNRGKFSEVEKDCSAILNPIRDLLSRKQVDDEKIQIRLIKISALLLSEWGPVLKDLTAKIYDSVFLRREYLAEKFRFTMAVKLAMEKSLPYVFQGLSVSLKNASTTMSSKRNLRNLFSIYMRQFEPKERHPIAKIFASSSLLDVQTLYYEYVRDTLWREAKIQRVKRSQLYTGLLVLKNALEAAPKNEDVFRNFVVTLFPALIDIYVSLCNEEKVMMRAVDATFQVVLQFSASCRQKKQDSPWLTCFKSDGIKKMIGEKITNCPADSVFELLNLFAVYDVGFARLLQPYICETVASVQQRRYVGSGTNRLAELLKKFQEKIK